jgi:single-stranded-DNA-specific exonuclease
LRRITKHMPVRKWNILHPDPTAVEGLTRELSVSNLLARLLVNRSIRTPEEARQFMAPSLDAIPDPYSIAEMAAAVERLDRALRDDEKILVYGDYDVDGVCSTSLMVRFLRFLGRNPSYFVPHRIKTGYGLSADAIRRFGKEGVNLLITVDCGCANGAEIALARELGMDVIVTDHHEMRGRPDAAAVINPKNPASAYPFRDLSGTGVAFQLAWAFSQKFSPDKRRSPEFKRFILDALALTALGTIADVVPLLGVNRIFATHGLPALKECGVRGLSRLIDATDLRNKQMTSTDVGFRLGPRLNAAGRLDDATASLELLLSCDDDQIDEIVRELESLNKKRQTMEARILKEARQMLTDDPGCGDRMSAVLANEGWHPGVIGVVASRLAEEYYRPVALVALSGGKGRGSARSIPGFHLHEALDKCKEHLCRNGGHSAAAGFEIDICNMDRFAQAFEDVARAILTKADLQPSLTADAELDISGVTMPMVHEISRLQPFGLGNSQPLFASFDLVVAGEPRTMGRMADTVSFYVKKRGSDAALRVVAFGLSEEERDRLKSGLTEPVSLMYRAEINEWQGRENLQLRLVDWKFERSRKCATTGSPTMQENR